MIEFGASVPMRDKLINWSCNQFLERLTWFIKKSKQFNQSDITALTLRLSVYDPLPRQFHCKAYANELLMKKVTSQDRL